MTKKLSSRKIKQVASKAKRTPRTETNTPIIPVSAVEDGKVIISSGDGREIEFDNERPDVVRNNAIERSKRLDLKMEIRKIVSIFRTEANGRLTELSERIEGQMKPLVQSVAEIAVAKKDFETSLQDFERNLSYTLNLHDELEPIDITQMFSPDSSLDADLKEEGDEDTISVQSGPLAEMLDENEGVFAESLANENDVPNDTESVN